MATSRQNPEVSHLLSSYDRFIYESVLTQSWRNLVFLWRLKWDLKWLKMWGFADGIARFNCVNKCTKSFLSVSSCDLNPKSLLYKLCDKTPHPWAPISSSQGQISSWIQKGRRTWTSSPLPFLMKTVKKTKWLSQKNYNVSFNWKNLLKHRARSYTLTSASRCFTRRASAVVSSPLAPPSRLFSMALVRLSR